MERLEPSVLPLAGGSGIVKGELPAGQQKRLLSGKGAEVRSQALALVFVRADEDDRAVHLLPKGRQMGPVDAGKAGHLHRGASGIQLGHQLLILREPGENLIEQLHNDTSKERK